MPAPAGTKRVKKGNKFSTKAHREIAQAARGESTRVKEAETAQEAGVEETEIEEAEEAEAEEAGAAKAKTEPSKKKAQKASEKKKEAKAEEREAKRKANTRHKGVQIHRPFVYGSYAKPIDPAHRPPGLNPDHTHQWTVFVRPVPASAPPEHLTYWLKKVQFKLHETYAQSTRTIESPPFEVTETGWGEFEVQMKLYFVPEANEKAQTLWHPLKLHPFGDDVEGKKERREAVLSQSYDEAVFTEPVEAFYEILTSPGTLQRGAKGGAAGGKQVQGRKQIERSAEIPDLPSKDNIYSKHEEEKEIVRMREAIKKVEMLMKEEKKKLAETEKTMEDLRKEGANGSAAS